jgi:hypothetical protein
MHEQNRIAAAGLFVIEPDSIIRRYEGHGGFLPIAFAMVYARRRSSIASFVTSRSITPEAKMGLFKLGASRS